MPLLDIEQHLTMARCKLSFISHALSWPPNNHPIVLGFPEIAGLGFMIGEVLTGLEESIKMIKVELAAVRESTP